MSAVTTAVKSPLLVVTGDRTHGVDRYAMDLADAVRAATADSRTALLSKGPLPPGPLHVHFTDRLWGSSPRDAAERFESLAANRLVSVTLHDLPQDSDGRARQAARTDSYRRVVDAAAAVACNSQHEAALLERAMDRSIDVAVIPLPVDVAPPPVARPTGDGRIAVLGFFYPGKGHSEVVDAVAALPQDRVPRHVVALGGVSPGHESELHDLIRSAAKRGVDLHSTGYLPDERLLDLSRRVAVPVIAHQHVSASGSLATWTAAGRRPIVVDTGYFREMAELRPGTLTLVPQTELSDAIHAALTDPESTWLPPGILTGPALPDVAAAYLEWWGRVLP